MPKIDRIKIINNPRTPILTPLLKHTPIGIFPSVKWRDAIESHLDYKGGRNVKKWLLRTKTKLFKALCDKNIHFYKTLFFGYPAFSDTWYKTSMCPHCKKTKLTLQKNPVLKPMDLDNNRNYITYNKNLTAKELELSREMVYKMNRKLKKLATPPKDTVK